MSDERLKATYTLKLTGAEFKALREAILDIKEYVDIEMFSSAKGLAAFNRIADKIEKL
jgi:hypothetical protein